MDPIEQITKLIEECGVEMRKPSLIPDWMAHETSARLKGNDPRHHLVGSFSHRAWMKHNNAQFASVQKIERERVQARIAAFVGPSQIIDGSLSGVESVVSDKVKFGGDY